jgi:hypothetical protein
MGGTLWLGRWGRQWTQLLIDAREFLSFEQCRDARATGQRVLGKAWINAQFRQQSRGTPAWMRPAHLHDGIAHACRKRAQRSSSRAALLGVETATPLMLPTTTVLATWVIRSKTGTARQRKICFPCLPTQEHRCTIRRCQQPTHHRVLPWEMVDNSISPSERISS